MTNKEMSSLTSLSKLTMRDLRVLEAIAQEEQPVTSEFLDNIVPYQEPAKNTLLRKLCNSPNPNEANFPFLIRERRGKNGKFIYFINPQISLNSIDLAMNQKMGVSENDQFVEETNPKQVILEKLEEIKTLVEANME